MKHSLMHCWTMCRNNVLISAVYTATCPAVLEGLLEISSIIRLPFINFAVERKNNIEKFDEGFRFQLTREELVRSKNLTSRNG